MTVLCIKIGEGGLDGVELEEPTKNKTGSLVHTISHIRGKPPLER